MVSRNQLDGKMKQKPSSRL